MHYDIVESEKRIKNLELLKEQVRAGPIKSALPLSNY